MSSAQILGAAAAVAILAVPALAFGQAQTPMSGPGVDTASPMSATDSSMAGASTPSAQGNQVNTNGVTVDASRLPAGQAQALAHGDNTLVTNGPVPDTPTNRAKYGRPLSTTGKKTPPVGN